MGCVESSKSRTGTKVNINYINEEVIAEKGNCGGVIIGKSNDNQKEIPGKQVVMDSGGT